MCEIVRRNGAIWAVAGAREVRLEPSHADRKRARYWRALDGKKPLTPWLPNPRIAALRALK